MLMLLLSLIILSSMCVMLSKNIIQSMLYLILVFLLCSMLFIYMGADFIGLIMLMVYMGAISVLFLFIVMMLNIRMLEMYSTFSMYLPLAFFLSLIFFMQLFFIYFKSFSLMELNSALKYLDWALFMNIKINLMGQLLFNEYFMLFMAATLLLFMAMMGVIVLVLDKNEGDFKNSFNYKMKFNNMNWKYIK